MLIRTFPKEWDDCLRMPIDIWGIQMLDRKFCRLVNYDEDEPEMARSNLILARGIVESAIIMLTSMFEASEFNKYIEEYKATNYIFMINNLGRANKRIDDIESANIQFIENAKSINPHSNIVALAKSTVYAKFLVTYMNHLVFLPIYNGYKRFLNFRGKKEFKNNEGKIVKEEVKKDEALLLYFIFYEFYKATEILGAITREDKKNAMSSGLITQTDLREMPSGVAKESSEEEPSFEINEPEKVPDDFDVFK